MQDDALTITPALPAHEAMIRSQSALTNAAHHSWVPHVFASGNEYQEGLLDVAFHPQLTAQSSMHIRVWVAARGDTPLGFVLVIWAEPKQTGRGATALIADIGTFDGARGQGVGQHLLAHVETQMQAEGWDSVVADVWHGNSASHALFTAAGFTPERTEYRLGDPPPLEKLPIADPPREPRNPWFFIAIGLIVIFIVTSIP